MIQEVETDTHFIISIVKDTDIEGGTETILEVKLLKPHQTDLYILNELSDVIHTLDGVI